MSVIQAKIIPPIKHGRIFKTHIRTLLPVSLSVHYPSTTLASVLKREKENHFTITDDNFDNIVLLLLLFLGL